MIILLGTSHISPESMKSIRKTIQKEEPNCVAVELDRMRYVAMISNKGTKPPGMFLKIISWMQKELGKMTGISPGEEMMEAVRFSRRKKIDVCLIDQDFYCTVYAFIHLIKIRFVKFLLCNIQPSIKCRCGPFS